MLVGELLFDPEADDAEKELETALRFFSVLENSESDSDGNDEGKDHTVSFKSAMIFHMIIKILAMSASFQIADGLASDVKEVTQMSLFGGAIRENIAHFVRVVCVSIMQIIATCMRTVYSFGIAFDVGANSVMNCLDIRVRFIHDSKQINLHLIAIPLHDEKKPPAFLAATMKMLDEACS